MILSKERKHPATIESDVTPLIIDSCGTKSTSQRCLNVYIHFCINIYICTHILYQIQLATHLRVKLSMTHSSDAPFAHPLSPNGLLSSDCAHSDILKTLHDSTSKNVRKERNTNYAHVGDRYWFALNSYVLFSNRIIFCNSWRNKSSFSLHLHCTRNDYISFVSGNKSN